MSVSIGLHMPNGFAGANRHGAARIAQLAESLGYESLWTADHVVLPSPRVDPSPLEPEAPLLDVVVSLAFLAAHTERILLATGCVVLPQRDPRVLAKQLASVDVLSGGRLVFGAAAGYLEPELRALGVPMAERGARTDEYLRVIRTLWEDERPAFHGRFADFKDVDAHPRPLQPHVPVVVGGHSPAAHRRAAALADGWYGWMLGLRAAAAQVEAVRAAGPSLHVTVTPARRLDAATIRSYADLGVDRLVVAVPPGLPLADLEAFVERNAPGRLLG
ncbi:TIGR03619 family F420-dependent LLM class oxidoreductase [Nonomuraea rhizosphaerae]|uniref:TIGR03619 family F420-dependent LLM class oxidoreductase n=1 Tax=Nonomuraea rhizosphaerae TaxID=2665663 RepID=UPI001C5CD3F8|nr:TIGR03619 family F420-dependent LLM class oxidoreductase [Nonomuraea rhizosphaerae]